MAGELKEKQDMDDAHPLSVSDAGKIESFLSSLYGIIPVLDRIRDSILESSGRIPKASMQLNSVTQATESAAVEILNVLESITERIDAAEKGLARLRTSIEKGSALSAKISDALSKRASSGRKDPHLASLAKEWEKNLAGTEFTDAIGQVEKALVGTKEDSMNIAMALQVQDITSQQIAGVTHMIESVRVKLTQALHDFGNAEKGQSENALEGDAKKATIPDPATFDVGAVYDKTSDRQSDADSIVETFTGKKRASHTS